MACLSTGLPSKRHYAWVLESIYHGVFPFCRPSQMHAGWRPAWTGFDEFESVVITRPPPMSGKPYTHIRASASHRLPSLPVPLPSASRIVGLPSGVQYGLRHGPASVFRTVDFVIGPPSLLGLPSTRNDASGKDRLPCRPDPGRRPPASSGFPEVCKSASGLDRPPCILHSIL